MRLEKVTASSKSLLYMERYEDEGAKTYSPFAARSEVAPRYQPRSSNPSFELVTVRVPRERAAIFEANPPTPLSQWYVRDSEVMLAVHPETWADADVDDLEELRRLPRGESITVAPTASTRTVLTLKHPGGLAPHFIKLHLPRRISRFNRRLRRKNIQNCVVLTTDLGHMTLQKFAFLPDALGLAIEDGDSSWGCLVRERFPRPSQGQWPLIPCFALFARDLYSPDDPPLLVQMIDRFGADPQDFVVDHIMVPVIACWIKAAREWGILLEFHAQNTLLEVDDDYRPRRIVHRDFDVWVDVDVRRRLGLELPFMGAGIGGDTGRAADQSYSLIYDRFIGHEFFDPALEMLGQYYSIDKPAVRSRVSAAFHRVFEDADRVFPARTMFYFSNSPAPGREFELVDLQQPPQWR